MTDFPEMKTYEHDSFAFGDNPCVTLTPKGDSPRACLEELLEVTEDLSGLFRDHPEIDEDEPWFGWAFLCSDGGIIHEVDLYGSAAGDPELRAMMKKYVERVIAFFQATDGEPGFYVNEEEEAGSKAVEALVLASPEEYLPLYVSFLQAIDLEHTCEQHSVVHHLAAVLTDAQRQQLKETIVGLSGGEYFPDF